MHDSTLAPTLTEDAEASEGSDALALEPHEKDVVSTHVLVEPERVEKLRELSRRTRIAQSEYLREAVDDLLTKYRRFPEVIEGADSRVHSPLPGT